MDLQPDAVVAFSMNKTNKSLQFIEKNGIPVVLNGDWLEETPLGRAEWIKFFGVLLGKEKLADSIFKNIESEYLKAKKLDPLSLLFLKNLNRFTIDFLTK